MISFRKNLISVFVSTKVVLLFINIPLVFLLKFPFYIQHHALFKTSKTFHKLSLLYNHVDRAYIIVCSNSKAVFLLILVT